MKQYNAIKAKYPDALLLFRVGDFYETFGSDAIITSQILGIVLTKRANGSASHIELAGFPHHSLDTYMPKLVRAGKRVAICDQLEDPKQTKTIVKRGVTEIITPGVTFNDHVLSQKSNNFLMSVHLDKNNYGISIIDVSTGELFITQGNSEILNQVIHSFKPNEIIYQRQKKIEINLSEYHTFQLEDWAFQYDFAYDKLIHHFKTKSLKGFGVEELPFAIIATGALFSYINEGTHHNLLKHITQIQKIPHDHFVWMDAFTIRNLELIQSNHPQGKSLLEIIDNTHTAMGGRTLKRWTLLPIKHKKAIEKRQNIVYELLHKEPLNDSILLCLKSISDVERLLGKIASKKINPKELGVLRSSLTAILDLKKIISSNTFLQKNINAFKPFDTILNALNTQLQEDLPVHLNKGDVISDGVSKELDELRVVLNGGKDYLEALKNREVENTGITSLKIDFNNVFGYYIEVRNTHKDKVPEDWQRKQTLVNAERYITEELKTYEQQILGAEEKIIALEAKLYDALCDVLINHISELQYNAKIVATIDVLQSFSILAQEKNYTKPNLYDNQTLDIKQGRHPVIEELLPLGESYIPNDVFLDPKNQQILMITGPNMSGKSALLRQTALICILAQMGSFVPAKHASLGLVDRIFTRVGASDNISQGESTFMVEMNETASILNNLSGNSLILLDEIGRGTSTYDGVSIAWSIAEYLHEHPLKPKTLFATHYHELNEMVHTFKRIKNFNVSIKEINGIIHFIRTLKPGGSEHSFGIHVAKLAGMPVSLTRRAEEILLNLEKNTGRKSMADKTKKLTEENMQLSFFQLDDPVLENIREELIKTDINTLTPIEALMKLNQIKKMIGE